MTPQLRWIGAAAVLACIVAGCSRQPTEVESGGPTTGATTPGTVCSTLMQTLPGGAVTSILACVDPAASTTAPVATTSTLPSNCHAAPASTAAGMPGGGEIVCETVPGSDGGGGHSSPGFPGSGETLVPVTTVPEVQPTATQGVLRVSVSGTPCSASHQNDPCPAIAEIVAGTMLIESVSGRPIDTAVTVPVGTGDPIAASMPVARLTDPGRYRLTVTPQAPNRSCAPVEVTVTAGQVTEAAVTCSAP